MQWVIQANIKKFKSLLKAETDPTKRAFIARLLEEEAKDGPNLTRNKNT